MGNVSVRRFEGAGRYEPRRGTPTRTNAEREERANNRKRTRRVGTAAAERVRRLTTPPLHPYTYMMPPTWSKGEIFQPVNQLALHTIITVHRRIKAVNVNRKRHDSGAGGIFSRKIKSEFHIPPNLPC